METGKPGLASASEHINSTAAQTEKKTDVQAPLTAVYIHTVPALPPQPYLQLPAAAQEPATFQLAMPQLYSKETLPFLTLHIAGGLQSQPGMSMAAAAPAARPKSAGKHMCPHCGRDCMKPSVLEKHLRCHTGERPYPCTTCGVSFKTQSNLYKHKRTQAHARLSSESEQSSLGSVDNMSSSRETFTSSLSLAEDATLPAAETTCPDNTVVLVPVVHERDSNETSKVTTEEGKQRMENEKLKPTASRHLSLKRQEATLFSKLWERSASKGKSQSHESTDSGFSESSDHYSSPCSVLPDNSIDSLTNSTKRLDETPLEPGESGQEPKGVAKEQEQKTLEERISKLISENTAVVEDKKLENVRPRKTVLSKQGSIDLPMPYTYKDSFQFDMRMSKILNAPCQRNKKSGFYSSVPTQHSTTMEHAPLTRSNSLPFSVTLLQPERSSSTSSYQSDYVTLVRRGSYGQINSAGFGSKPVNQQLSTHRPLVRQTAVDCNHATDGLSMNSSVEEACTGSLSCDGDGSDICGEPSNRKFRRKKTQKFAYNKWYMYGGGTFKKLYNAEKGGDESVIKGRKCSTNPEQDVSQGLQKSSPAAHKEAATTTGPTINLTSSSATRCHSSCPPAKLSLVSAVDLHLKTNQVYTSCNSFKTPQQRNLSMSVLPLPSAESLTSHKTESMCRAEERTSVNDEKPIDCSFQHFGVHVPSERKKQKTDDKNICLLDMETDPMTHISRSVIGSESQQDANVIYMNLQNNQKHTQLKGALFPPCIINASTLSAGTSPTTSSASSAKTSFLPKYQLKLPNATAEPDSDPSLHVKPIGTSGCTFTSAPSPSHTEQTSSSATASVKTSSEPVTSLSVQSCEIKQSSAFISPQSQLLLPCTSSLTLVHKQFATATITTNCLQDYQAGLFNTSVQPSKFAGSLSKPVATIVANVPAAPTITTANNQPSAARLTAFSHSQHNPNASPLVSHTQLSAASDHLNPVNSSNAPAGHCDIAAFDQIHTAAQNVFHVHTADLQICLQIISDEQLALIEPKIEGQAHRSLSQQVVSSHNEVEAVAPRVIQNKAQDSVSLGNRNEGRDHHLPGHQKALDQRHMEGASLTGCAAQTEQQTWGQEETPGQPDSVDLPKQSQDTGGTNHRCTEGLDDIGVVAEDKNRGMKTDAVQGQCKAESNCRYTCSQHRTKPEEQEEDGKVRMDSFKTTWLSRQHLQHLSQTHLGMSEYPKKTQSTSDNFTLPACNSQTSLCDSPLPRNIYFSQQCWESNSSQHIKAQVQINETQNFSQFESGHQQIQTFLHQNQNQDEKQTSIMSVSCCAKLTLGSGKSPSLSPDIKTSSSIHHHLSNNNVLDNNAVLQSKPLTYPEPDGYQDTKNKATSDRADQSSNSERSDISNKYQSFFLTGQHHYDYSAECLPSGVRPVQSCQDYTEDTSSSDDEGKLIIEL